MAAVPNPMVLGVLYYLSTIYNVTDMVTVPAYLKYTALVHAVYFVGFGAALEGMGAFVLSLFGNKEPLPASNVAWLFQTGMSNALGTTCVAVSLVYAFGSTGTPMPRAMIFPGAFQAILNSINDLRWYKASIFGPIGRDNAGGPLLWIADFLMVIPFSAVYLYAITSL